MKRTWKTCAFWIALAELTGALSGWLTRAGTERFQAYGPALFWLVALWCLILGMLMAFRAVDRTAGRLQIPDLLWAAFAAYLNLGVWLLDRQPSP